MDSDNISGTSSSFFYDPGNYTHNPWIICDMIDKTYLGSAVFVGLISVLGTVANIGLLVITCLNKTLRTPSNIFLINVIIGDLIYIVLRAPLFIRKQLGPTCWITETVDCKIHSYFETVAQYVCILSLTALSVERYMAVVRGLESRQMNNKNVKIIGVVITWGMSLVLAIPTAVIAHIKLEIICTKIILSQVPGLLYDLYYFLTLYFVPLMVISTLYVSIAMTLYKSGHTMLNDTRHDSSNRRQTSQRRRLAMIFVLITVSFAVFWLPHFVFVLWKQAVNFDKRDYPTHSKTLEQVAAISALLNACVDPYIVFAMSTVYRKHLSNCCRKKSGPCSEKSESLNLNNHNRNNYQRPSVTMSTSLRTPQSTFSGFRRNSPSTVNSDTAL